MATIALNGTSINFGMGICAFDSLGTAFSSAKKTTGGLQKAIGNLITKIDLAKTAAKVETAQTEAKNAKTREETKESSLTLAYDKLDTLINDVGTVDNKVSTKVSAEKNDFYKKYEYLKPECEKSKWEQFCDWCGEKIDGFCNAVKNVAKKIADWCKKKWNQKHIKSHFKPKSEKSWLKKYCDDLNEFSEWRKKKWIENYINEQKKLIKFIVQGH